MKKTIACILCLAMLIGLGLPAAWAAPAEEAASLVLLPANFSQLGTWAVKADGKSNGGSYDGNYLVGFQSAPDKKIKPEEAQPAIASVDLPADGTYYVWARSRDFPDNGPGNRHFQIQMGETLLPTKLGAHGNKDYDWALAGSVDCKKGKNLLGLIDTSVTYPRTDVILLTTDANFIPSNDLAEIKKLVDAYGLKPEETKATETTMPGTPAVPSPSAVPSGTPVPTIDMTPTNPRPDDEIAVNFNGEYLSFDVPPALVNDRTLVPMRAIFEKLGCTVTWEDETQTATGERNGKLVSVSIGSKKAKINDHFLMIDQPAELMSDRTMVPLRFISEAYDAQVDWDEATSTVLIKAVIPPSCFFLTAESYKDLGTWTLEGSGTMGATSMKGLTSGATLEEADASSAKPAVAEINVTKPGTYKVWVHARDFKTNQQGARFFNVAVNGEQLPVTFGQHGQDGFKWTDGGTITLQEGKNKIELIDSSGFFARTDGMFITEDMNYTPSETYADIMALARPVDLLARLGDYSFPEWVMADGGEGEQAVIQNDKVKVSFSTNSDEKNGSFVQNEIYLKQNGQWERVKEKAEGLGYLMLQAEKSVSAGMAGGAGVYQQTIDTGEDTITALTSNIYKSGIPTWLIPNRLEQTGDNQVTLYFDNAAHLADVTVVWELEQEQDDPKVTIHAAFPQEGAYTFGMFSGKGYDADEYSNVLAPYIVMQKRVPEEPVVYLQQYLFTPMAVVTLDQEHSPLPGSHLTTGIAVDGDSLTQEWIYTENSHFGMTVKAPDGDVKGMLFAPMFGTEESNFAAGDSYEISFRVINQAQDWFDTYKYIAQNLYNVHDYRSNYYTSLNEAIYNTTELMMDDEWGGWDPVAKEHYNMEEKDLYSVGNAMEAVQRYLLTEDEDILTERAIPTLAALLTRGNIHFKPTDSTGGANYLSGKEKPSPVGDPISGYNFNVFAGLFEMSRGMTPQLYNTAVAKADKVVNAYGSIPSFVNDLSLYEYTGLQKYLDDAIKKADAYLQDTVYGEKYNSTIVPFSSFLYISHYPNLASLLDIYEVTGEQRYLDAAIKTGQMLSSALWSTGIEGSKGTDSYTIDPAATMERRYMSGSNFWWHGSIQWRLGSDKGEVNPPAESKVKIQEETVPGWLPSRVGLGLEQGSTFAESLNIVMSSWAGDMVKLAEYSGEPYFEMVARNAIVGRFGNYSGYYQNRLITHQMKADYPYTGPDYTSIYWHHIPPFLAMLEDFLINEFWAKSDQQITFPSARQQGYAYFNSNQYGFEAGKVYDQNDMWIWLDRGIVEPESVQIDYLPARKDGVLAVSFLNEDEVDTTSSIALGEKVPGGAEFTGSAVVYAADGSKSELEVTNGKFTLTVPAKNIVTVVLNIPGVKAPAYSKVDYDVNSAYLGETVFDHGRGKGYVLQLTPENYYAYVYVTDKPKDTKELKMNYKIGDQTNTVSTTEYPFEFIIKVDDPSKDFSYNLEVVSQSGAAEKVAGGTLRPVDRAQNKTNLVSGEISNPVEPGASLGHFEPFPVSYVAQGNGAGSIRLVVPLSDFPFDVTENALKGLPIKGTLTNRATGEQIELDSVLNGNEIRPNQVVLLIQPTEKVPSKDYDNDKAKTHTFELKIYPLE